MLLRVYKKWELLLLLYYYHMFSVMQPADGIISHQDRRLISKLSDSRTDGARTVTLCYYKQ